MTIDPAMLEATSAIRKCPACGERQYAVKTRREGEDMRCVAITCTSCDFDILAAWKAQKDQK
jgi:DNA-directed RNA polymerase subunit M/transcription elongation factor TFIIS